jgi:hypothetical protein
MEDTARVMTLDQAGQVADLLRAVEGNRKVGRLIGSRVVTGEARSFGDAAGNFDFDSDVRDMFLRVTLDTGFEAFWPVAELMGEVRDGYFVVGYEPPAPADLREAPAAS